MTDFVGNQINPGDLVAYTLSDSWGGALNIAFVKQVNRETASLFPINMVGKKQKKGESRKFNKNRKPRQMVKVDNPPKEMMDKYTEKEYLQFIKLRRDFSLQSSE